MNWNEFVKRVVVAGGFLLLCAAPRLSLGQSSPAGPGRMVRPTRSAPARVKSISPTEYLAGLTLTDDQKTKIDQIREETKSHLATVAKDQKLGPEVKEAMLGGFQRIENTKIFEVLTPEQQHEVRRKLSDLRAAAQPQKPESQQAATPQKSSQSN